MKIIQTTIILFCTFISLTNAQTLTDSSKTFKSHSLQFRVYNFLSLSYFKGTLLSYKYHSSSKNAFRVGMSVNIKKWQEQELEDYSVVDTTLLNHDRDHNNMYIEIMVEYLRYLNLERDFKIFLGIGPRINFNINNFDTENISISGYTDYTKKYIDDRYQIGLTLSYGLEWFFRKNMSLHAEYGFNISYFYEKYKNIWIRAYQEDPNRLNVHEEKRKGIQFDDTGGLFGLSIYF